MTRRTSFGVVTVATAIALSACASGRVDTERTGSRADRIQGGASEGASPFAVAILEDEAVTCSGTLIAPNLVLTARHCVADDDGGSFVRCSQDRFLTARAASGFNVSTHALADFATAEYQVTKVLVPSDTLFCGNDIALLVLDKLVPAAVALPASPVIDPPLSKHGTKITAIGYGITGPGQSDDGTRRRRNDIPIECIPGDGALDCDPQSFAMTAAELAAGDGLCEGDSGSGAFSPASLAAGKPVVLGVLSRAGEDGAQCTEAVYVRTDAKSAFLLNGASEAAKAGGYALPAWAGGASTPEADAGPSVPAPGGGEEPPKAQAPDQGAAPTTTTTTASCSLTHVARAGRTEGGSSPASLAIGALAALGSLIARRRRSS